MNHTNEELVATIKSLANEIANLNIDKALLQARIETLVKQVEELQQQLEKQE